MEENKKNIRIGLIGANCPMTDSQLSKLKSALSDENTKGDLIIIDNIPNNINELLSEKELEILSNIINKQNTYLISAPSPIIPDCTINYFPNIKSKSQAKIERKNQQRISERNYSRKFKK